MVKTFGGVMPFQKIEAQKLSSAVVRQVERLILTGVLRPGERLPSERDLAERLGVSRPSLRDAIGELQGSGLVTTRAGAGLFVSETLDSAFPPALTRLFRTHREAVFDYIDFRRDIEGLAAERAATQATEGDLKVIRTVFERMERAGARQDPEIEARDDANFHMAIVEAAHNVVLLHTMRALFGVLTAGVFYNRRIMFEQRTSRAALLGQHRAILTALEARDPSAAREAVAQHLGYVEEALRAHQDAERHEDIAQLRLRHEHGE